MTKFGMVKQVGEACFGGLSTLPKGAGPIVRKIFGTPTYTHGLTER